MTLKTNPTTARMADGKFNSFYRAVVEDNIDPEKRGRVRVRIWGLHTEVKEKGPKEGIPTEELPWAEACLPIMGGAVTGMGMWGIPVQGSHVMIFFENGNYFQCRYFASLPGNPTVKANRKQGFNDPNGIYPKEHRLNQPDWHRLARGEKSETIVDHKDNNRDQGVATASGTSWSEPASPYAAQYPNNFVIATHGGVIIEMDSTPGNSRVHIYHPSNSYIEIDHDGNTVIKANGNKYEVTIGAAYEHCGDGKHITSDGDVTVYSKQNVHIKSDGQIFLN